MQIINKEYNEHKRVFLTILIEGKESFKGDVYKHVFDYSIFAEDLSGRTHEIDIRRETNKTALTGQRESYKDTYCVGCGSGANMGWELNLTKREAFKIARARMAAINSDYLVAGVYISN